MAVCSCVLTVALCTTLKAYQSQPIPTFGTLLNTGITLNTVVSILATLSVASSVVIVQNSIGQLKWLWYVDASRPLADLDTYDSASRGTVGSLQLLWRLRFQPSPSLGAILIVVNLAIAPLVQQSVVTRQGSVAITDGTALAPINNAWDTSQGTENLLMPGGYNRINATMKGAVLSGLFYANQSVMPEIAPSCGSGNCTFQDYQSLAVCSSVADVTGNLTNSTSGSENQTVYNWCLTSDHCLSVSDSNPTVALVTSAANNSQASVSWQPGQHLTMLNYTSIAFADHPGPLADFYIIYRNTTHAGFNRNQASSDYIYYAVEFVVDWCVPTFETSVVNGTAMTTRKSDAFIDFNVPRNFNPYTGDQSPLTASVGETNYTIDQFTHNSLQRYLWYIMQGVINGPGIGYLSYTNNDQAQALWAATQIDHIDIWQNGTHQVKTQTKALAALGNILNNTAISMSNLIRQSSNQPSFQGQMTIEQSIVVIDWGYAAALVVFNVATLLFLFTVVWGIFSGHRKRNVPIWKSGTNAILRCLEPDMQRALGGVASTTEMTTDAADLSVRLVQDKTGWHLVAVDDLDRKARHVHMSSISSLGSEAHHEQDDSSSQRE